MSASGQYYPDMTEPWLEDRRMALFLFKSIIRSGYTYCGTPIWACEKSSVKAQKLLRSYTP